MGSADFLRLSGFLIFFFPRWLSLQRGWIQQGVECPIMEFIQGNTTHGITTSSLLVVSEGEERLGAQIEEALDYFTVSWVKSVGFGTLTNRQMSHISPTDPLLPSKPYSEPWFFFSCCLLADLTWHAYSQYFLNRFPVTFVLFLASKPAPATWMPSNSSEFSVIFQNNVYKIGLRTFIFNKSWVCSLS